MPINDIISKRNYITGALILFFFALAFGLEFFFTKDRNLHSYQLQIESSLHDTEQEVDDLFADKAWLLRQYSKEIPPQTLLTEDLEKLSLLTDKDYNICLYRNEELVFWTNNRVFLSPGQVKEMVDMKEQSRFLELPNGFYELRKMVLKDGNHYDYFAVSLIPVRNKFAQESEYLINQFTGQKNIPKAIDISDEITDFSIKTKEGNTLTYLKALRNFKDTSQQKLLLLFYLLAFVTLGILLNGVAVTIVRKYKPWIGAAFLVSTVFLIRWLSIALNFKDGFSDLNIFTESFKTPVLQSSLGDLLINIIILLWLMVFFHREFQVRNFVNISKPTRWFLTTLNYFSIVLGMLMVASVFRSLILHSGIKFDFDNVFNLNIYSLFAVIGIILLVFAHFLFSHRMILTNVEAGLSVPKRMICLGIAIVISLPIIELNELGIRYGFFILSGLAYVGLFDWFKESRLPNLTWVIFWLVLLALLSSLLLFKYNNEKDINRRIEYAQKLATREDGKLETSLSEMRKTLKRTPTFKFSENTVKDSSEIKRLAKIPDLYYTNREYLFNNYSLVPHIFRQKDSLMSRIVYQKRFESASKTKFSGVRLWENKNKTDFSYLVRVDIPQADPNLPDGEAFLELKRKQKSPSKVYTELLLNEQYKGLEELNKYDYAIYKSGILDEDGGKNFDPNLYENKDYPAPGTYEETVNTAEYSEITLTGEDGTVVIIGKDMGGYLKPISLFSYLFGLLVLATLILAVANTWIQAIPRSLNFSLTRKPSLGNRIQMSVILLILTSFVFIGAVTVWFFQKSSDQYHEDRLERKVRAALKDAEHEIDLIAKLDKKENVLTNLVNPISEIHRMDINLYNTAGNLLSSSEEGIFKKGIISPKMGAYAFQVLKKQEVSEGIQNERVGDLSYKAAYVPVRNADKKVIAYMGLPYYSKQRKLRSDVSDFMGTLINVYVFLLLLAGVIAIVVANSISKPITNLGIILRNVQLGGRNERIFYDRKDEVGQLIQEYNRMIATLEEQSDQLGKAEREGAWREMAKQVAHEIKNPLTPMKLSIQLMMHAYKRNPDNIGGMIERVSDTLIEQIDGLTNIATEFSNFAKMPSAENSEFEINNLVTNVHDLFQNENENVDVTLEMPSERFTVFADKSHLMRVLNNLVKNAIQAIPDERKGLVHTSVKHVENDVLICVSDNGTGISEEMKSKVFQPYFTTKNSGTGLGLAISRKIIEMVKGRIWFETEEGKGTDFYIQLPLVAVNSLRMLNSTSEFTKGIGQDEEL
jgi:signal transduction histidine kinase